MLERIWAKLPAREKIVGYAVVVMIVAHLIGVTMSNGYYAGDFADGGTLGLLAILVALGALGAVLAHNASSGPIALPASYGVILAAAGVIVSGIGAVLFLQISAGNSDTIAFFHALHPTAADAEIPITAFVGALGLLAGGLAILYVGWREHAIARKPGARPS
jgi:hypothetical protein